MTQWYSLNFICSNLNDSNTTKHKCLSQQNLYIIHIVLHPKHQTPISQTLNMVPINPLKQKYPRLTWTIKSVRYHKPFDFKQSAKCNYVLLKTSKEAKVWRKHFQYYFQISWKCLKCHRWKASFLVRTYHICNSIIMSSKLSHNFSHVNVYNVHMEII